VATSVLRRVVVVGTGLVGTSIALALRANGVEVSLVDHEPAAVAMAVRLGAGVAMADHDPPADLAVIAVPPSAVVAVLEDAQDRGFARLYTDVAAVKGRLIGDARRRGCDMVGFVPGHPIYKTTSGSARADLFHGSAWVLCPEEETCPGAVEMVEVLVRLCGAEPVVMTGEIHDRATAHSLHVPYLVSSAMAAALVGVDAEVRRLVGSDVRDVTRLAEAEPADLIEALTHNAKWVADVLSGIAADLVEVSAALQLCGTGDLSFVGQVTDLLHRGNEGRRALTACGLAPDQGTS